MARGAWGRVLWSAAAFRQAIAMGDDEEPIDVDPYGLFPEIDQAGDVAPYDPAPLEAMQREIDREKTP